MFYAGVYNRLQFLRAVSHSGRRPHDYGSVAASHRQRQQRRRRRAVDGVYCDDFNGAVPCCSSGADEPADCCCEVCLVAPREGFALQTRSLMSELCEQSGYARLLSRVPCKLSMVMRIFM